MNETATRESVIRYVGENYGVSPEYPWMDSPGALVFRHADNAKWFGLVMDVAAKRLRIGGEEAVDVLNVKCDPMAIPSLLGKPGYLPAYHMSKEKWISILLDGSLPLDEVAYWIDQSFLLTASRLRRSKGSCAESTRRRTNTPQS